MNIRARFQCQSVEHGPNYRIIKMQPVYSSNKAAPNHQWSQATPSGSLSMQINNPGAFAAFEPGEEYDILFTPTVISDEEITALRDEIAEAEKVVAASPTRADLACALQWKRKALEDALAAQAAQKA